MWVILSFSSALFAGITAILAKCGMKDINSNLVTALRTIVVLIFSVIMVMITGGYQSINDLTFYNTTFLVLSGLATGASWLCYFKALSIGDVNKVTPIDKSSTILTMILAVIFFNENLTIIKIAAIIIMAIGTYLMIQKKESTSKQTNNNWLIFACLSAIFASLTSLLCKVGVQNIDSNLGTAIRTFVVLIMAWLVVFTTKSNDFQHINKHNMLFIVLSGVSTGASWLCYYKALQTGPASVVVPIDKLSILVTILFSFIVFKEKLNIKSTIGLIMIVGSTLILLI